MGKLKDFLLLSRRAETGHGFLYAQIWLPVIACIIAGISENVFPQRIYAIILADVPGEIRIGHIRPVVFVESGCVFERRAIDIEYELVLVRVDFERAPGHREELVADS